MRFLVIAPRFHTNLYYRVIALQNAGHIVKVLVLYKGKSEYYKDIDLKQLPLSFFSKIIIKAYQLFKQNYLKSAFELFIQSPGKQLNRELKNFKPDFILLKAYQNMLAVKSLILALALPTKVLVLTQTTKTTIFGSILLFKLNIYLFKLLKVHAFITPTQLNYNIFKKLGIKNVYYVPFVFPAATNHKQKQSKYQNIEHTIKIISVGKFTKRKDQLLLLAAFNLLKNTYKIKLDLYGENADNTYYQEINKYITKNNLSEYIRIFLNTPYSKIIEKYNEYELFILPSYKEPAAYSLVEAMAHGLAVICSNENGTRCYIENEKNGFIFEAKNEQDLKKKIEILLTNSKKRKIIQEKAILSVIKNHNMNKYEKKIIKILNKN